MQTSDKRRDKRVQQQRQGRGKWGRTRVEGQWQECEGGEKLVSGKGGVEHGVK